MAVFYFFWREILLQEIQRVYKRKQCKSYYFSTYSLLDFQYTGHRLDSFCIPREKSLLAATHSRTFVMTSSLNFFQSSLKALLHLYTLILSNIGVYK